MFAQETEGLLHYINGNREYYTSQGSKKKMEVVDGISFVVKGEDKVGFCSEFEGDSNNIIVTARFSTDWGVLMYDIENGNVLQ